MKKFFAIFGLSVLALACAKEAQPVFSTVEDPSVITFSSDFTKVVTNSGVNTWEANDSISVFSIASTATAGESIDTNFTYFTATAGASATFAPRIKSVSAADKYVAYYPKYGNYPSKLNEDTGIGFSGVAAKAPVVDYRFMPVTVNSNYTATVDPETKTANINTKSYFYAVADQPANPGDNVSLTFTPILPVLEFGFFGKGEISNIVLAYADNATDVIGTDKSNWLQAKGVFNPVTKVLTTTNSNTSYHKLTVTLANSVRLSATEATRFPMTVGRFRITKGLNLIFTDARGNSFTKKIWDGTTVSGVNGEGKCVHLYQKVNVPYVAADMDTIPAFATAGGSKDLVIETTAGNWTVERNPAWISFDKTSGGAGALSVIAAANSGLERTGEIVLKAADGPKCYIAVSQEGAAASDNYKVTASAIDWTSSKIQYVVSATGDTLALATKELKEKGKTDLVINLYKGKDFSAKQEASAVWYISADGQTITTSEPSGSIGDAAYVPMYLFAPSGEANPLVKVGVRIFTINGYKTSKWGNGTDISTIASASMTKGADYYIYNGYAVGASGNPAVWAAGFAPEGWSMIDATTWKNIGSFIGTDASTSYNNFLNSGLFTRNSYTSSKQLTYVSTWSAATKNQNLLMWYVNTTAAPASSTQDLTKMFEAIVFKKVQ